MNKKFASLFLFFLAFAGSHLLLAQSAGKEITLEDIFKKRIFALAFPDDLQSLNDGDHYCVLENDTLNKYEYLTGKKSGMIFCTSEFVLPGKKEPVPMQEFSFSPDETKVLITSEKEYIYRRSAKSNYFIYDLQAKQLQSLSENGKQQLAGFSPDGSKVAFVRANNLFVKDLPSGKEEQITTDGKQNSIINGAPDWVYEEEFEFAKAYEWSPDGSKIAFYRFDESRVKEFSMTKFTSLYPEVYTFKYPKAGEDNSLVQILIYDLRAKTFTSVDLGKETDIYIPRIHWTADPGKLLVYRLNRLQNHLEFLLADATTGLTTTLYEEEDNCYVEINDNFALTDRNQILFTSERDGFQHLYLLDPQGKRLTQVTKGKWEVSEICAVDSRNKLVYYLSTEAGPQCRDLYRIGFDGTGKTKISSHRGTNSADFSRNFKYYTGAWSDANTPPVTSIFHANGKEIRILEDNQKLREKMKEYGFGVKQFFSFKTSEGDLLNCSILKPKDFDSTKKYAVLLDVYGGPGSQTVLDSWPYGEAWYHMLGQKGYLIVSVDPRGTGGRGAAFKKSTYLKLMNYETRDLIEAARYLGTLPYVDAGRIGIWGWSYGGSMAATCITRGAEVFKAAIAVAPVTNFRYYDNIYSERFLRTPKENPSGYDEYTPMAFAKNLKGKFLLVHGTADDNVHVQNSMDLVKALVKANKPFDTFFYPDQNHNIRTGGSYYHLFNKMASFILENL